MFRKYLERRPAVLLLINFSFPKPTPTKITHSEFLNRFPTGFPDNPSVSDAHVVQTFRDKTTPTGGPYGLYSRFDKTRARHPRTQGRCGDHGRTRQDSLGVPPRERQGSTPSGTPPEGPPKEHHRGSEVF